MRCLLIILQFIFLAVPSFAQEDSSSSRFLLGLELQEGMERGGSFLSPTLEFERGVHRVGLGGIVGFAYRGKAGSRGSRWVKGRHIKFRGLSAGYGLRFWQASDRVSLRAGLIGYYFQDDYRQKKGDEDPLGNAYVQDHRAVRRSWAAAPSLTVEFDAGSTFSLGLGFQPFRYRWSSYRWEGNGLSTGSMRIHRFLLRKFEVKYRL